MNNHLTGLSFLSGSNLSFAEKEQKNTRQEFSFGDDHCVTRFNFFANYSLINTEKKYTHSVFNFSILDMVKWNI